MASRFEIELRFIVDTTRPTTALERETMVNILEAAEDQRAARGIVSSPDIDRVRRLVAGEIAGDAPVPARRVADAALVLEALRRHHGNRTHAARELGVALRTVRNILVRERVAAPLPGPCVHDAAGEPVR